MGSGLLEFYQTKVKREWKIAFLSAFLMGLLIHIYKFTNTLPNHDSLFNYYSDQNIIGSGRWLLSLACGISSYFDLPWINGLLSLVYISAAVVLIVDILEIRNPVVIALTGALLMAFPGTTETFFFGFTADGYMLSMLLATIAVWLTRMEWLTWRHSLLATLCICCACGIYQAYVSFAMVLALCYFILILLDNRYSLKQIRTWVLTQIIIYVAAMVLYYVLWKVLMGVQGVHATGYQGINNLTLSLGTLLGAIPETVKTILLLFLEWNPLEHGWTLYGILNVVFLLCTAVGLVLAVFKTRLYRRPVEFVLAALALGVMPFAACIWLFASPGVAYRPMMLLSICLIYILSIVVFERYLTMRIKNLFALLLTLIIFNNSIMANIAYYYMNREYCNTYRTAMRIDERIEALDGNTNTIAVYGIKNYDVALDHEPHANRIHMLAQLLETDMIYDGTHLVDFINETFYRDYSYLNIIWNHANTPEEIQNMPSWPEDGSIQIIDGVIVIKLSNITSLSQLNTP